MSSTAANSTPSTNGSSPRSYQSPFSSRNAYVPGPATTTFSSPTLRTVRGKKPSGNVAVSL